MLHKFCHDWDKPTEGQLYLLIRTFWIVSLEIFVGKGLPKRLVRILQL